LISRNLSHNWDDVVACLEPSLIPFQAVFYSVFWTPAAECGVNGFRYCELFATGYDASETPALTAMAMKTVLKKKETTPWVSTVWRMAALFT
jgi:hypothetical protein